MSAVMMGRGPLSIEDLVAVARHGARVDISEDARSRVLAARTLVETWVAKRRAVYGVTTGFGALCDVAIPQEQTRALQENILMSHAAGVGEPFADEVVRATMAVRVQDLAKGRAGLRLDTLHALVALLNSGVIPVVPEKGSVGASGDLAPMAHLALVLIGRGEAFFKGRRMPGAEALAAAGLRAVSLEAALC